MLLDKAPWHWVISVFDFKDESKPIMSQKWTGASNPSVLLFVFSLGVISIRLLPVLWPGWMFILVGSLSLLLFCKFCRIRWLGVFWFGLCWAGWIAAGVMEAGISPRLEKKELVATGSVASLVRTTESGARFIFRMDSLRHGVEILPAPGLVRLTAYTSNFQPQTGERWQFTVRLKRPHGLQNPGASFNFETWLFQQRIRATGYIVPGQSKKLAVEWGILSGLSSWINRLRQDFAAYIASTVDPDGHPGIIAALTVGVRHQMSDLQWQVLQNTGTIHLVAISGLHIGLVSALIGLLGAFVWRRLPVLCRSLPAKTAGIIAGLWAGFGYAMLAGFTVPTRRAITMLAMVALVMILKRKGKPLELLVLVLALILLLDPLAPFSSSFWLSFSAVSILVMVALRSKPLESKPGTLTQRIFKTLFAWIWIQFWLLVGMMPVLLVAFHKVSLVAPVANLIAVPLIGMVVVPLSLVALLTYVTGLWALTPGLLELGNLLLDLVWQYLVWLASLPVAVWQQGQPPWWTIGVAITGVIYLSRGVLLPARLMSIIWMLPMMFVRADGPLQGEFVYTLLDVGQGLASVIQTSNHVLVYDTGAAYPGGFNLGKVAVDPYLRYLGASQIDQLIISHGDNDHIGGAAYLATAFDIESILTSVRGKPVKDKPTKESSVGNNAAQEILKLPANSRLCSAGQHWNQDGVEFTVLWPLPKSPYVGNDSSCVLKVSSPYGSVLLTGDIETGVEQSLVSRYADTLKVDVLQIPHHGSTTSSSFRLMDSVQPVLAVVSAGYLNRYRHPSPKIMDRYAQRKIPTLNTTSEGAITIAFRRSGVTISAQRNNAPGFWQQGGKTDLAVLQARIDESLNFKGNDIIQPRNFPSIHNSTQ